MSRSAIKLQVKGKERKGKEMIYITTDKKKNLNLDKFEYSI